MAAQKIFSLSFSISAVFLSLNVIIFIVNPLKNIKKDTRKKLAFILAHPV
jgi:hypothetical protein